MFRSGQLRILGEAPGPRQHLCCNVSIDFGFFWSGLDNKNGIWSDPGILENLEHFEDLNIEMNFLNFHSMCHKSKARTVRIEMDLACAAAAYHWAMLVDVSDYASFDASKLEMNHTT